MTSPIFRAPPRPDADAAATASVPSWGRLKDTHGENDIHTLSWLLFILCRAFRFVQGSEHASIYDVRMLCVNPVRLNAHRRRISP